MSKALVRPKQTNYPLPVVVGRDTAALWLGNPVTLLAAWRDHRFSTRACGMDFNDLTECRRAFNEAPAQDVTGTVVGMVIIAVEVSHA